MMKAAEMKIVSLQNDIVTTSGEPNYCIIGGTVTTEIDD